METWLQVSLLISAGIFLMVGVVAWDYRRLQKRREEVAAAQNPVVGFCSDEEYVAEPDHSSSPFIATLNVKTGETVELEIYDDAPTTVELAVWDKDGFVSVDLNSRAVDFLASELIKARSKLP